MIELPSLELRSPSDVAEETDASSTRSLSVDRAYHATPISDSDGSAVGTVSDTSIPDDGSLIDIPLSQLPGERANDTSLQRPFNEAPVRPFVAGGDNRASKTSQEDASSHGSEPSSCAPTERRKRAKSAVYDRAPYQAKFASLQEGIQAALDAGIAGNRHRNEVLGQIEMLAVNPDFVLDHFCKSNKISCSKTTRKRPTAAIIKAALPTADRKLHSKWSIGSSYAAQLVGPARVTDYLNENGLEACVKGSRAERRGLLPAKPPRSSTPAGLLVVGAPPALEGLVTMTVHIVNGAAKFLREAPSDLAQASSTVLEPLPNGHGSDAPPIDVAPVNIEGSQEPALSTEALAAPEAT